MFRIVRTSNRQYAAAPWRGINLVKGKGEVWTTKNGIINACIATIQAYCCRYDNNISFNDITIHIVSDNVFVPATSFFTKEEQSRIADEVIKKFKGAAKKDWRDIGKI